MSLNQWLDNPVVWELSRRVENFVFGLYQRRFEWLRQMCISGENLSVLEIGCGIGQYARITRGSYLGIDFNERYICYARKKNHAPNQSFRCADATVIREEKTKFDVVLMVDFLHHVPDETGIELLRVARDLAKKCIVNFEPIADQPRRVGRWIVENDRGHYVRPLQELNGLFEKAGIVVSVNEPLWLGPINTRVILATPQYAGEKT